MPYEPEKREQAGAQGSATVSFPRVKPEAAKAAPGAEPLPTATDLWDADRAAAQRLASSTTRRRRTAPAGQANLARPAPPVGDTTTTFTMPEAYRMPSPPPAPAQPPAPVQRPAPHPAWGAAPRRRATPPAGDTANTAATLSGATLQMPAQRAARVQQPAAVKPPAARAARPAAETRPAAPEKAQPAAEKAPARARRTRAQAEAALYQNIHDDHLWLNNPVLVRGLGLAPAIVAVTTAAGAVQMCAAAILLLTATRVLAVALCHLLGGRQRPLLYAVCGAIVYIPAYCLLYRFFGADLTLLGIYLPLLVTDPAIIKRMEAPELETVPEALQRGINNTMGFCLALLLLGMLRELLSAGTVFGYTVLGRVLLPLAAQPAGGFILVGLVAAVWTGIGGAYVHYKQEEVRHLYAEHKR